MRKLFILILVAGFTFDLLPQSELKFERYTTKHGLANNYVNCICQDDFGFLWFATRNGVSRFDGLNFRTWQYDEKSSNSIGQGWVNQIECDDKGRLWFAILGQGSPFFRFDYENECFIDCATSVKEKLNISDDFFSFNSIFTDSEGIIWLGGMKDILHFNPEKQEMTKFTYQIENVRDFIEDKNKNIWIAGSNGLSVYNRKKDTVITYKHVPGNNQSISSDRCICLYLDSQGMGWVGTYNGVNRFVPDISGPIIFERFMHDPNNPNSLPNNIVSEIAEDNNKNVFFASLDGLCVMDRNTGRFSNYYHDEIDNESINSNLIRSLFRDKHGNMWVGTSAGIGKILNKNFRTFKHSAYYESISNNKVQSLCEGLNSELWIATPKGIDIFNVKKGRFHFIAGITQNEKGLYGPPVCFFPDASNKGMWVGTWNGGFSFIDYSSLKITNFIMHEIAKNIKNVFAIYKDSKGNLWVGSHQEGIYVFNSQMEVKKFFTHDNNNNKTISSNFIFGILEDSGSDIWIGTQNGLCKLENYESGYFKRYMDGVAINCFIEGSDKHLWIGTKQGLYRFNKKAQGPQKLNIENWLPGNDILGLLEDQNHDFWVGTDKGFINMNFDNNKIVSSTTFREKDGLDIGDFLSWSNEKTSDGTMLFGGSEGFCMFNPKSIVKDTIPPSVIFTNLSIGNKTVEIGKQINNQVVLQKSISLTKQLILNHKNNAFAIEFAALQYNMPKYNYCAYRLEGYDSPKAGWHYSKTSDREVEYMNLPSGKYIFKLKAANSYGIWNNTPTVLSIEILPPWWKTLWFRAVAAIVIVAGALSFYYYRLNALKRQKRVLEQKVAERTAELRDANSQLEEKQEEILQQNEEIITVNNQLKTKNEEIESSRKQLEKAFQNISVISEFGQKITATFDFDTINKMIYEYVSSLMDTAAFGVGIFNVRRNVIDFPYFMEKGKPVPYFFKDLKSTKSLSVRCFKNSEEIIISNLSLEYKKYLHELPEVQTSQIPSSVIHLPLKVEQRTIGTLTVNSFNRNAYNENDIANLRTLASYISIALDNSKAYRIIRSKNDQINGSIRYGQTIQQAMLPPKELIDNHFENFTIFRPKDVVSGDFYWFATVETLHATSLHGKPMHFLAVVDCTGHGVPGAFMSMIGSRLLNDIVIERKIYSPAKILDQLNTMIRTALRQDTTDNHDGMDVCLCRFMPKDKGMELTYAGAKRPLLYFNTKTQNIEEIDGTRRSIGGVASRKAFVDFSEETIPANNEMMFYLSTDGLIDQCNPQKRKFSQKKLIGLLQQIHMKPVHEQKKNIENSLDEFQQGYEQRDDITLIGIKIL